MTPQQISQALKIRMLKADLAERALLTARREEARALSAVAAVNEQLADFDRSFEMRVRAFRERTVGGITPESLHSARSFHVDLARERTAIEMLIEQADQIVDAARRGVNKARDVWRSTSQSADNLRDLDAAMAKLSLRNKSRLAEQDADELSLFRAYRDVG